MVASQEACEAIRMRKILVVLFSQEMDLIMIYCDSKSCIKLFENQYFIIRPSILISSIIICDTVWRGKL